MGSHESLGHKCMIIPEFRHIREVHYILLSTINFVNCTSFFCFFRYFPTFLGSSHYCKHQIDILTSGKVFLSDILYNQNAMFYFMEVRTILFVAI